MPHANDVVLASAIDLRAFAGVWRLLVPDWDASAAAILGVADPAAGAVAVVTGRDGKVLGVATGRMWWGREPVHVEARSLTEYDRVLEDYAGGAS